jgi:uncharacterized YccA/Bax inhibitor family protein
MPTSNPVFSETRFRGIDRAGYANMSLQGTINRLGFLSILLIVVAGWAWQASPVGQIATFVWPVLIFGFIVAIVTIFNPKISMYTSPVYAILEGMVLGSISAFFNAKYPGVVSQALMLTFGILVTMLLAYKMRLIQATQGFRTGVVAATGAICLVYIADLFMRGFLHMHVPYIHEGGLIGIGVSIGIVVVASLNLILDFDSIERSVDRGAPKYMEWYCAFGILVTMVWLYLEVLRLLVKLKK